MKDHSTETRRALFTTEARKTSALCSLHFLGSVLVAVGFFGPWVAHRTAALTMTGYELSEFAKFFPQVQQGTVPVRRALFLTPLLAAVISLALVIHRSNKGSLVRVGATAVTLLLGLAALPPIQAVLEPQYRVQLVLTVAGLLLTLTTPLTRQLSEQARGVLLLVLTLIGAAPALWQAVLIRPLVAQLYETTIWPGWGLIVCIIGFLMLLAAGMRSILRP